MTYEFGIISLKIKNDNRDNDYDYDKYGRNSKFRHRKVIRCEKAARVKVSIYCPLPAARRSNDNLAVKDQVQLFPPTISIMPGSSRTQFI